MRKLHVEGCSLARSQGGPPNSREQRTTRRHPIAAASTWCLRSPGRLSLAELYCSTSQRWQSRNLSGHSTRSQRQAMAVVAAPPYSRRYQAAQGVHAPARLGCGQRAQQEQGLRGVGVLDCEAWRKGGLEGGPRARGDVEHCGRDAGRPGCQRGHVQAVAAGRRAGRELIEERDAAVDGRISLALHSGRVERLESWKEL